MTIKELKAMAVGTEVNDVVLTVKHTKKSINPKGNKAKTGWIQQVVLMDETGDMLADIKIDRFLEFVRGQQINCIVTELRDNHTKQGDKLLYIEEFERPAQIGENLTDEYLEWKAREDKTVRSKIKCLMTVARIDTDSPLNELLDDLLAFVKDDRLDEIIDSIVEG